MNRLKIAVAVCVLLSLGLTVPVSAKPVVTFGHAWQTEAMVGWLSNELAPAFERKHGARLDVIDTQGGAKLTVLAAAGELPDVFISGSGGGPMYGFIGWAIPLNSYIDRWTDAKYISKSFWQAHTREGIIWAVPYYAEIVGYAYNKHLFAQVGLDASREPGSWTEMATATRRLTRIEGDKVVQSGFEAPWDVQQAVTHLDWWAKQTGSSLFVQDGTRSNLSSQPVKDALAIMKELRDIARPSHAAPLLVGAPGFANQQVAMADAGPWLLDWVKGGPVEYEEIGLFAPRRSSEYRGSTFDMINGLVITSQSRNPNLAWDLVSELMSNSGQIAMAEYQSRISVRTDVATRLDLPSVNRFRLWYALGPYSNPAAGVPRRAEVAEPIMRFFRGEASMEEAIVQAEPILQAGLDNMWKK